MALLIASARSQSHHSTWCSQLLPIPTNTRYHQTLLALMGGKSTHYFSDYRWDWTSLHSGLTIGVSLHEILFSHTQHIFVLHLTDVSYKFYILISTRDLRYILLVLTESFHRHLCTGVWVNVRFVSLEQMPTRTTAGLHIRFYMKWRDYFPERL